MSFVDNFIEENKTLVLLVRPVTNATCGILVKVSVVEGNVQFSYTAVLCDNGDNLTSKTPKDAMRQLKSLGSIPIDVLAQIVRFDSRFTLWKTGQHPDSCLILNDSQTVTDVVYN